MAEEEAAAVGPVTTLATPIRLDYDFTPGVAQSRFLRGLAEGRFLGQRCPVCRRVYVPSRGTCPTDGVATDEDVVLSNSGTVTTYCVVNVPFAGQSIEIPYICAQVLLDGADLSFMGLIQEIPTDQIRMGMRVEAVWVDKSELTPSLASVRYFRPNGEPDAEYDTYKEYL
ncbi:MAG TPA: Zn-ribbon domain-containing OB-fold protein [Acidimicrobiales bacterium]|nr:Zn-ribbon domain-containing OB-fold protein [Acidimicrobiales bacterium]